jgi:hypothetical protein
MLSNDCLSSSSEIRVLSWDPGFVNFGWSVVSWRDGLISVLQYGIFPLSSPQDFSVEEVLKSIESFKKKVFDPFRSLFDSVIIEYQPYVPSTSISFGSFKLQQIYSCLMTWLYFEKVKLDIVHPNQVRRYFGLSPGNHFDNKKTNLKFVESQFSMVFGDLIESKRNHVADTVLNTVYYLETLSKKNCIRNGIIDKSFKHSGENTKKRSKLETLARARPSPVDEKNTKSLDGSIKQ